MENTQTIIFAGPQLPIKNALAEYVAMQHPSMRVKEVDSGESLLFEIASKENGTHPLIFMSSELLYAPNIQTKYNKTISRLVPIDAGCASRMDVKNTCLGTIALLKELFPETKIVYLHDTPVTKEDQTWLKQKLYRAGTDYWMEYLDITPKSLQSIINIQPFCLQ